MKTLPRWLEFLSLAAQLREWCVYARSTSDLDARPADLNSPWGSVAEIHSILAKWFSAGCGIPVVWSY